MFELLKLLINKYNFVQDNYENYFVKRVYEAPVVSLQDLKDGKLVDDPVRIQYRTREEYKLITKKTGLMDDFKASLTFVKGFLTVSHRLALGGYNKNNLILFSEWCSSDCL